MHKYYTFVYTYIICIHMVYVCWIYIYISKTIYNIKKLGINVKH